jgi:hypothetical protein
MKRAKEDLKSRIISEMTVDHANSLEKNFDLAKQYIRVTKVGKVDVTVKDRIPGKLQILLYLIGKLYAKEAGLVDIEDVSNKELTSELGIPMGSVLPWLKELREKSGVKQVMRGRNTNHSLPVGHIEKVLKLVERKMSK